MSSLPSSAARRGLAVLRVWVVLAVAAGAAWAQPVFNPQFGRACRNDLFFVDVPLSLNKPWSNLNHANAVRVTLAARAVENKRTWFCEADDAACAPPDPVVTLESVLPVRAETGRTDAHLRFLRYRFSRPDGAPMPVASDAGCDIVATIRDLFVARGIDAAGRLNIGRECEATGQTEEGLASPDMELWHMDSVGIPRAYPGQAREAAYPADIALIDAPVDPTLATALSVRVDPTTPPGMAPVQSQRHGSAMAVLLRQVAPSATIRSYTGLDALSTTPIGTLAWALDRALYDATRDRTVPLAINLSLGWPAEFGYRARILGSVRGGLRSVDGVTCDTWEDPAGESVRFMLERARAADMNPGPVSVFAAAGNRTEDPAAGTEIDGSAHPQKDPCADVYNAPNGDLFFPAAWALRKSCKLTTTGTSSPVSLAIAVGGIDDRGLNAVATMSRQEVPLVAPGEHVYASIGDAPIDVQGTAIVPWCDPGVSPPDPTFGTTALSLPLTLSGTSAATALATATAARTYQAHAEASAVRVASGKAKLVALDHKRLHRLLYVTGFDLGRTTPPYASNLVQRQLRADRAAAAMRCAKAPAILTCVAGAEPGPIVDTLTFPKCAVALNNCALPNTLAPVTEPVQWGMDPAICGVQSPDVESVVECPDVVSCPFPRGDDPYMLGGLGPQPPEPFCPECKLVVTRRDTVPHRGDFVASLSKSLPVGTYGTEPSLEILSPDGRAFTVSLASAAGASAWTTGATLTLPNLALGTGTSTVLSRTQWLGATVRLRITQNSPGKLPATTLSPVRISVP